MENKVYPRIKNAILLCLLLLVIQLGMGGITGVFQLLFDLPANSILMNLINIMISLISFGIVIFIGFKKTKLSFNEVFKFNNVSGFLWGATIIFSIGMIIVVSEIDNLLNLILPMPEYFRNLFGSLMGSEILIIAIIYIGIIPAFVEELLFRGLILDGLNKNYTKKKAIIVSALLFGLIHLNPWQFVSAFLIGLVAAWICIETKSIVLCIFIHFFNNTLYTLAVNFNDKVPIRGFNSNFAPGEFQPLWFTVLGLATLVIGSYMLIEGVKREQSTVQQAEQQTEQQAEIPE